MQNFTIMTLDFMKFHTRFQVLETQKMVSDI
jgi:hypothetical protein